MRLREENANSCNDVSLRPVHRRAEGTTMPEHLRAELDADSDTTQSGQRLDSVHLRYDVRRRLRQGLRCREARIPLPAELVARRSATREGR